MKIHRPSIGCFLFSIAIIVMTSACSPDDGGIEEETCGNGFCDEIASSCPEDCEVDAGQPPSEIDAAPTVPDAMPPPPPDAAPDAPVSMPPQCGNTLCETGETPATCSSDCETCGDALCTGRETPSTCASDCQTCNDGLCTGRETPATCSNDCYTCGDNLCTGRETFDSCPGDCGGTLVVNNYSSYTVLYFYYMLCSRWPSGPWSGDQLGERVIPPGTSYTFFPVRPGCYYFQARAAGNISWTTRSPGLSVFTRQTSTFSLYN